MKKSHVQKVSVPHYDELSVKSLWPQFSKDKEFTQYFPDKYPVGKGPPRQYFFDILNTLHPEYLQQVMNHANEQRMSANSGITKKESIAISQYWEEELKSMPYLSCKFYLKNISIDHLILLQKKMVRHSIFLSKARRRFHQIKREERQMCQARSLNSKIQKSCQEEIPNNNKFPKLHNHHLFFNLNSQRIVVRVS